MSALAALPISRTFQKLLSYTVSYIRQVHGWFSQVITLIGFDGGGGSNVHGSVIPLVCDGFTVISTVISVQLNIPSQ